MQWYSTQLQLPVTSGNCILVCLVSCRAVWFWAMNWTMPHWSWEPDSPGPQSESSNTTVSLSLFISVSPTCIKRHMYVLVSPPVGMVFCLHLMLHSLQFSLAFTAVGIQCKSTVFQKKLSIYVSVRVPYHLTMWKTWPTLIAEQKNRFCHH